MAKKSKKKVSKPDVEFPDTKGFKDYVSLKDLIDNQGRRLDWVVVLVTAVIITLFLSFVGFVIDSIRFHSENVYQLQENRFATDEVELLRLQMDALQEKVEDLQK